MQNHPLFFSFTGNQYFYLRLLIAQHSLYFCQHCFAFFLKRMQTTDVINEARLVPRAGRCFPFPWLQVTTTSASAHHTGRVIKARTHTQIQDADQIVADINR